MDEAPLSWAKYGGTKVTVCVDDASGGGREDEGGIALHAARAFRAATTEPVAFRAEVIAAAPSFCQLESARAAKEAIDEHLSPPSAIGDLEKVADDGSLIGAFEGFKEGDRETGGTMTSGGQADAHTYVLST